MKATPSQPQKKSVPDLDSKTSVTLDARLQNHFTSKSQSGSMKMAKIMYGPSVCTVSDSQNSQSRSCANASTRFGNSRYGGVKTYHIDQASAARSPQTAVPVIGGPFGKLVLIERANENAGAMQTIHDSTAMCQVPLRCEYDQNASSDV